MIGQSIMDLIDSYKGLDEEHQIEYLSADEFIKAYGYDYESDDADDIREYLGERP